MNTNRISLKRSLRLAAVLISIGAILGVVSAAWAAPVQAAPKKTRTPTPSRTPLGTATSTPAPFSSPTPGPTTGVDGTWRIVDSPNVGSGTYGNRLLAVDVVASNDVWAVGFSPHPSGTP